MDRLIPAKLEVIEVPVTSIKPYPTNPKEHPERQIEMLMASISKFGMNAPLLLSAEDDTIATTLESSVDALTAGIPLSLEQFEGEISRFLTGKTAQQRAKVIRLSDPQSSGDGGSLLHGGSELPDLDDTIESPPAES